MDLGLTGRTAIVAGASSGIGLAIAEALAEEGANVAMFARRRELLEREADRLGALAVRGDVTNRRDLQRLVEKTVEAFGTVDILVNNSGGPPPGAALELEDEAIESALELLLFSYIRLTRFCLPYLGRSSQGRIINISSLAVREPAPNIALTNVIRPGVVGWSKMLAKELGPRGITVNSIAPGRIETARTKELYPDGPSDQDLAAIPLGRFGEPRELAALACFLASRQASYVTGTLIQVDGGLARGLL